VGWYEKGPNGRGGSCAGSYPQNGVRGAAGGFWSPNSGSGLGGEGGSKGAGPYSNYYSGYDGIVGENPWGHGPYSNNINGGWPGGGSGGAGTSQGGGNGGWGAVRIIWEGEVYGTNRSFPSNNCNELNPAQGYQINVNS
jgi:hypothetical protein